MEHDLPIHISLSFTIVDDLYKDFLPIAFLNLNKIWKFKIFEKCSETLGQKSVSCSAARGGLTERLPRTTVFSQP